MRAVWGGIWGRLLLLLLLLQETGPGGEDGKVEGEVVLWSLIWAPYHPHQIKDQINGHVVEGEVVLWSLIWALMWSLISA